MGAGRSITVVYMLWEHTARVQFPAPRPISIDSSRVFVYTGKANLESRRGSSAVERCPEEASVGGSTPSRGTKRDLIKLKMTFVRRVIFSFKSWCCGASELLHLRGEFKTAAICAQQGSSRGAACELAERRRGETCRQLPPAAPKRI